MSKTIDYKNYPSCVFAMVASYLREDEAEALKPATGDVVIRHVDKEGNTYKNGLLHSFDDQPAIIFYTQKIWYRDGKVHRDGDLPAHITDDFGKKWFKNGLAHRDGDLPALIEGAVQAWYKNGERHRDGDLPAVINGYHKEQIWYKNGKMHREGGKPAFIDPYKKTCFLDGAWHTSPWLSSTEFIEATKQTATNFVKNSAVEEEETYDSDDSE